MTAGRRLEGEGNIIEAAGVDLGGTEFEVFGDRNRIVVGEGGIVTNTKFVILGSDNLIEIGENCDFIYGASLWIEDNGCEIRIGSNTTIGMACITVTENGSKASIGKDCLLAYDIDIRTGDSHSILDVKTGECINHAEDVSIGDHVWIGAHAIILKGVSIGDDSVIGTGSVVTSSCEPGSLMAGNPARVTRTGIRWQAERVQRTKRNPI